MKPYEIPGDIDKICPSLSTATHDSREPGVASNASSNEDKPLIQFDKKI